MCEHRIPDLQRLHVYLTDRCNNRCDHCWVLGGPDRASRLAAEPLKRQIDKAIPLGLRIVKISGGEPFLYRNTLQEVMQHAADRGLETRLETNATLVGLDDARLLGDLGVHVFASLDGSHADTHDRFRGRQGSHSETLAGIKRLRAREVRVHVISSLYRGNVSEWEGIARVAIDLGVSAVKFNFATPYGRAIRMQRERTLLTTREVLETTRHIELGLRGKIDVDVDVPRVFRLRPNARPRCPVLNLVSVLPDGSYSLCGIGVTHRHLVLGHVQNDDVDAVWRCNRLLHRLRDDVRENRKGLCRRCTEYEQCMGHCLAYCLSLSGELQGPHPLCHEAFAIGMFPEKYLRAKSEEDRRRQANG